MTSEEKIAKELIKSQKTLAIAESCTGGLLSHRITNIPGSSQFFKLGIIVYANEAKIKLLGIDKKIIDALGAVSARVAVLMAQNVKKLLHCDIGVGMTGIAGPSGGSVQKPVGLVYIALSTKKKSVCQKFIFKGTRREIKTSAASKALSLLLKSL